MNEEKVDVTVRIGLSWMCFILFCIFLILKLTGYVEWSWWWILAPLWIPGVLIGIVLLIAVIVVWGRD